MLRSRSLIVASAIAVLVVAVGFVGPNRQVPAIAVRPSAPTTARPPTPAKPTPRTFERVEPLVRVWVAPAGLRSGIYHYSDLCPRIPGMYAEFEESELVAKGFRACLHCKVP